MLLPSAHWRGCLRRWVSLFRIQIGDQIIEVDEHSLVGVTHTYATNVLKSTSGLVK